MGKHKAEIMARCTSLFENVARVHEANMAVMQDLKELSTITKDLEVFSKITQVATPPLVACYTPRIDKFIYQRQQEIEAKHEKLAQRKTIREMMELSNLPQYIKEWISKKNKEKAPTRYMVAVVWFFIKREMSRAAWNIRSIADTFKVNRNQLSWLITTKKFRSGPSSYIPKKRKLATKEEPSTSKIKKDDDDDQEKDELEGYLLQDNN